MKILILSANTGQGHNSAGKALIEEAEKRGISCTMIDTLLFASPKTSKRIAQIHTKSALYMPKLFKVGNQIASIMDQAEAKSIAYYENARYAERIYDFILANQFDVVIATHIFAAEALTHLRSVHGKTLYSYFVVTDYTYTPFVSETDLDGYFIPHAALLPLYRQKAPGKRCIATGIPVTSDKIAKISKEEARQALHLPASSPILLLVTGSMGYGNLADIVTALQTRLPSDAVLLAFCGTNEKLKRTLTEQFAADSRITVHGYTQQLGQYYDACDVMMSKPGGLSSTEAAVREIPLVQMTPIPGWEEENIAFFTGLGLSRSGHTPERLAEAAIELLTDRAQAEAMKEKQKKEINKYAARDILDRVIKDYQPAERKT